MRKIFSLIAAVLFAGSMMAQVTITPSAMTAAENTEINATIEGVSLNITQGTVTADQIRIFKNQTITISAESNITSIEFTCTANGTSKYGPGCFAAQDGYTYEAAGKTGTWTGSATSVTFTASTNQVRATQIVVTLEGGEVPPTPTDTYTVAGSPASVFGSNWDEADATNDMVLANGIYKWEKEVQLSVGTIEFKVVKNHDWNEGANAYPANNYVLNIAEEGTYTITITFDPATTIVAAEAVLHEPLADPTNCAEAAAAALSVSANNELYNNGAVYTIEGYVTSIKTAYNDQYHNVSFWMADAVDGGEVLQAYRAACASEEDVPAVGAKVQVTGTLTKYGTTPEFSAGCTFVITEAPAPAEEYYLTGSFRNWATTAESDFHFVANPAAAGEYMLKGIALAANAEIKVIGILGENVNWYPAVEGNYTVEAEGEYDIYFRPDGQGGADWHQGYFYVAEVVPPTAMSLTEFIAAAPTTEVTLKDLTVIFAAGKNTYVIDEDGVALVIYDASQTYYDGTLTAGKVLSGQKATYTKYKNQDEIIPTNAVVATDGVAPVPTELNAKPTNDNINRYISFKNVAAAANNGKYYIYEDVQLYGATGALKPTEDGNYDVEGIYILYNGTVPEIIVTGLQASTETAINNTNVEAETVKFFENGQLIIIKNGVRYNAQGAVVR